MAAPGKNTILLIGSTGTLVCNYQHTAHYDPLFLPGVARSIGMG